MVERLGEWGNQRGEKRAWSTGGQINDNEEKGGEKRGRKSENGGYGGEWIGV